jgi:hypothetical protein
MMECGSTGSNNEVLSAQGQLQAKAVHFSLTAIGSAPSAESLTGLERHNSGGEERQNELELDVDSSENGLSVSVDASADDPSSSPSKNH